MQQSDAGRVKDQSKIKEKAAPFDVIQIHLHPLCELHIPTTVGLPSASQP